MEAQGRSRKENRVIQLAMSAPTCRSLPNPNAYTRSNSYLHTYHANRYNSQARLSTMDVKTQCLANEPLNKKEKQVPISPRKSKITPRRRGQEAQPGKVCGMRGADETSFSRAHFFLSFFFLFFTPPYHPHTPKSTSAGLRPPPFPFVLEYPPPNQGVDAKSVRPFSD